MKFQHDQSWDLMTSTLATKTSVSEAWNKFIDYHELIASKPYWARLRELDIESEQREIIEWLQYLFANEPMPDTTIAMWIGLFKSADGNKEVPTIHICGCNTYNQDDSDWASNPSYLPKGRYAQPGVLQNLHNIISAHEHDYEFLDWILPLAYCAFTFDEVFRTKIHKATLLKNRAQLHITVGHDNGDYIELTSIN